MQATEQKIIVVAGANGRTGQLACDALIARARAAGQPVLVRGLVRQGSAQPQSVGRGQALEIEAIDYGDDDALKRVCAGAYAVVSALQGMEDVLVGVQSRLLRAAIIDWHGADDIIGRAYAESAQS